LDNHSAKDGQRARAAKRAAVSAILTPAGDLSLERVAQASGAPLRLQVLALLAQREYTVNELAELLGCRQPTLSKHLAVLRALHLVHRRIERNRRFYSLSTDEPAGQGVLACVQTLEAALAAANDRRPRGSRTAAGNAGNAALPEGDSVQTPESPPPVSRNGAATKD
jgi:DNA-binding transcriptional ArsR family regulator